MRARRAFTLIEIVLLIALLALIGGAAGFFAAGSGDPSSAQARGSLWATIDSAATHRNITRQLPTHPRELRWPDGTAVPVTTGPAHGSTISVLFDLAADRMHTAALDNDGDCWLLTANFAAESSSNTWVHAVARADGTTACTAANSPEETLPSNAGTSWDQAIELP